MKQPTRRLSLWPLVAATYFMVSGGPYGLEDLIAGSGYRNAIIVLCITPIIWSLPTAMMVGELSAAIPEEGGYYAWVRRALGPFWGFQEAWLSLVASIFDMAIYPTLFTLYIGKMFPAVASGPGAIALGAAMIAACALINIVGVRAVGGTSLLLAIALLAPFVLLVGKSGLDGSGGNLQQSHGTWLAGVLVAMWNYMGWDNASTIARDVDRPARTYPLAMLITVALVAVTYVIPVAAAQRAGLDPSAWSTGSWVQAAEAIGGRSLATAVIAGGAVCGLGMFNALVLSYSRLPVALAHDGYLPAWLARSSARTGAPWVAILVLAAAYAACLGLGFQRLVELDVLCYGLSLALEFLALIFLRVREPRLERPFRVPGGLFGAALLGLAPMTLLAVALVEGRGEAGGWSLVIGAGLCALGPGVYWLRRRARVAAPGALP